MGRDNDVDVKITDFGLAKRANKEGLKTFCGTPQYFAPEVLKRRNTVLGVGRYGKEADMWSVGELLRGGGVEIGEERRRRGGMRGEGNFIVVFDYFKPKADHELGMIALVVPFSRNDPGFLVAFEVRAPG